MKLLLGTNNPGKVREISKFLEGVPLEIISLRTFEEIVPVRETEKSFLANARLKASEYFRQTGLLTLAEDSGLQIDALDGQPGPLSARFAGEEASDADNVTKVLRLLRGIKPARRTARFVCVVAITDGRKIWIATGKCEGRIATRPCGKSGFGYDPIFIPNGYKSTFARLGDTVKDQVSHRAEAFCKVRRILERITGSPKYAADDAPRIRKRS
ncbi:MAG: RdgB/HAM1 family non-canonical purine NTP pyrophosphatase [Candidatus Abyssobacteria bacterium SURF_5]|uniref:dITP/XTP pyrophosphatase n=1 Tax=Abyssobacteria bacterium (strain SURF_5) TaxID=2093360 RepID=A0A3A4NTL2_ABYX5|nr:MAG: RdgB/HAM1 family non-canonical purine NTP pyrophosphatase [Candidatus Abyssubacteria bacterium SURF_5]